MLFNWLMYCLLLLGVIIFNIFFDGYLAFFCLMFTLLLPLISFGLMFFLRNQLNIKINTITSSCAVGDKCVVRLTASTKNNFISGKVRVRICTRNTFTGDISKDYIYISPSVETHNIDMIFNSANSGSLLFEIDEIKVYDFLVLFHIKKKVSDEDRFCRLTILPLGKEMEAPSSIDSGIEDESNEYSKKLAGDDPSEIYDIREYRDGDKLRRIHRWLSEKHNKIIVKDFGEPISKGVLVLVDFSDSIKLSESTLELLYGLLDNLREQNIRPAVKWFNFNTKQVNEFSLGVDFNVSAFFSIMLESAECKSGLLENYSYTEDFGKYSTILYLCSKPNENAAAKLYELSEFITTVVYEICSEENSSNNKLQDLPIEYNIINIENRIND